MKLLILVLCLSIACLLLVACAQRPFLGVTVSNTPESPECLGAICSSRK